MRPRYIVRRVDGQRRYSVWDSEQNKIAVDGFHECADLSFEDAFKKVDKLNDLEQPGDGNLEGR